MDPCSPDKPLATAMAQVNLFPERRQKRKSEDAATDISRSSRLSGTTEAQDAAPTEQSLKRHRQTVFRVQEGSLNIRRNHEQSDPSKKRFFNPVKRGDDRRKALVQCAVETRRLLPGLLATRPDVSNDAWWNTSVTIDHKHCPKLPPVTITVANCDSFDATAMMPVIASQNGCKPVAILNMANAKSPGGGWEHGAMAQEEALCYRSSLASTLHKKLYPIPDGRTIYSPTVLVIRENFRSGHQLVDLREPSKLSVVSIISCAAVCQPQLRIAPNGDVEYADTSKMTLMFEKIRNILRTAIVNGHRQIVLGAFGCGAFGNPKQKVAELWRIVLQEKEFSSGWWTDIIFAVLGESGDALDNYRAFHNQLHGVVVN